MKLEVLGTNAAFAKEGVNNSFILWDNDGLGILLDCGFSVYQALLEKGYAEKLKAVLVSHLHQDHCGSLVNLLDYRYKVLGQTTAGRRQLPTTSLCLCIPATAGRPKQPLCRTNFVCTFVFLMPRECGVCR